MGKSSGRGIFQRLLMKLTRSLMVWFGCVRVYVLAVFFVEE